MRLRKKAVLLHPLSGTEAALLKGFEKKLAGKFGGKAGNSLSLHPLSEKKGGGILEEFYDRLT